MHLVYSPKFRITIVMDFLGDDCNNTLEKQETMVTQTSAGKQGALWSM